MKRKDAGARKRALLGRIKSGTMRLFKWACLLLVLYQVWIFGHVLWYRDHAPETTSLMRYRIAHSTADDQGIAYQWVDYPQIAGTLKHAVIAAEDSRFMDHNGFDWEGIRLAAEKDIRHGKFVAGGSTISQQLAKNLFLSPAKNPLRKMEEALITVMLESCLSKRRILELYLNVIEWGDHLYGAEAASRYYFGIPARQLSPAQATRLAAMIPRPRYYQKHPSAPQLQARSTIYLFRMQQVRTP